MAKDTRQMPAKLRFQTRKSACEPASAEDDVPSVLAGTHVHRRPSRPANLGRRSLTVGQSAAGPARSGRVFYDLALPALYGPLAPRV
jgi:hypothetical protein